MKQIAFLALAALVLACNQSAPTAAAKAPAIDEALEKAAILATIEKETDCFYRRNYECWKENFIQADYAFQAWNNADGTVDAKTGWAQVDKGVKDYLNQNPVDSGQSIHPRVEKRNVVIKFFSDKLAYLVWDQYNGDRDGKVFTFSKDQRIMEKQDGKWKIANVSAYWDYKNKIAVDSIPAL